MPNVKIVLHAEPGTADGRVEWESTDENSIEVELEEGGALKVTHGPDRYTVYAAGSWYSVESSVTP